MVFFSSSLKRVCLFASLAIIILSVCMPTVKAEPFPVLSNKDNSYQSIISEDSQVVIFFWTSNCYYCRQELKQINQRCSLPYRENIKFYYTNIGQSQQAVAKSVRQLNLDDCIRRNIFLDADAALAEEFRIFTIPTYIMFKNGEVVHRASYIDREIIEQVYQNS